jgi:prevent-host-death family protein
VDVIAAADAKTNFGALLDKAQREPVKISKNSRDVAVVMSIEAFNEYQEVKLQLLRRDIQEGLNDLERGAVVDGDRTFRNLEQEFG